MAIEFHENPLISSNEGYGHDDLISFTFFQKIKYFSYI